MRNTIITTYSGTSREIGIAIGKTIGERFAENIDCFVSAVDNHFDIDFPRLREESMKWLTSLPPSFLEEFQGIAKGSGCSLQQLAEWCYCDRCVAGGCTSFILKDSRGDYWVGRNNDYILPKAWGYINILKVTGKIPVMLFGLEGEIFSGTGYNREQLWLHYNWLPVWDSPKQFAGVLSPFVFLRMALESCKSIADVKQLIHDTRRDGGMNLFVVDGKTNQASVLECSCDSYQERPVEDCIAGANHYCQLQVPPGVFAGSKESRQRQQRVEQLLASESNVGYPRIAAILGDSQVEQIKDRAGTVYANVACPSKEVIYYAHDGFPAASNSWWELIKWKW